MRGERVVDGQVHQRQPWRCGEVAMDHSTLGMTEQQERIAELFLKFGFWKPVPLPEIMSLWIAKYDARIHELRHKFDWNIGNRTWRVGRQKHSEFTLYPGSWKELQGKPEAGARDRSSSLNLAKTLSSRQPLKSFDDWKAEREKPAEFALVP